MGWLTGRVATCPTIRTERLVLRPLRAEDLDDLTALMAHPDVRAALHLPETVGRTEAWQALVTFAGLWAVAGFGQWALEERATGRFVGRAGLYQRIEPDWPGIEVGWALHPEFWGQGLATEAGAAAVRYGFTEVGAEVLWSVILPENTASASVARRLGFTPHGDRVLSHFPLLPHTLWRLGRRSWLEGAALSAG